ncbi:uncharacterized protein Bfra_007936 [Botrytis fragariae]|uniref:Uncharacterized protein n=1 Tax=Botrytis fragariae TaxID=1964551 RepID=A0A8H6AQB8_9HELO|nr:uncharacterized protein Bfra_007936 [Botrytis fragariae]KAF5871420.1 hypothetical protein Bfra_007936 [Botrytis fragariae]
MSCSVQNDVNPSNCGRSTFKGNLNLQERLQDLCASDSCYISRSVPWNYHGSLSKNGAFLYIRIADQFLPYKVLSVLTAWSILPSTSIQTYEFTNENTKASTTRASVFPSVLIDSNDHFKT